MLGQGLASVVDAGTTLRHCRSNLSCLLDTRCTGPVLVFFYTGRTPAQCFLCVFLLMYKFAYFKLIICMFFFTYITCFVITTVSNIFINKK